VVEEAGVGGGLVGVQVTPPSAGHALLSPPAFSLGGPSRPRCIVGCLCWTGESSEEVRGGREMEGWNIETVRWLQTGEK